MSSSACCTREHVSNDTHVNRQRWSLSGHRSTILRRVAERVLTLRELNRALLARQLLLQASAPARRPRDRAPRRPPGAVVACAVRRPLDAARRLPHPSARTRSRSEESREGDAHAVDASSRIERRLPDLRRGDRRCSPRKGRATVPRGPRRRRRPPPARDDRAATNLGRVAGADDQPCRAAPQARRDLAAVDRRLHARAARPPAALRDVQLLPRRALRPLRGLGRCRSRGAGRADAASRPPLPRGLRAGDDRRHGVVDGRADAGDPRGARRRAANVPRRGRPAALRRATRTAPCAETRRAGAPASQVGLLTARLLRRPSARESSPTATASG